MKIRSVIFKFCLVCSLCAAIVGCGYDLRRVRQKAEQGDARAQNELGTAYYYGTGVDQDTAEAVKWYRTAAEQGYTPAQFNLGNRYYNGQGVVQDYTEAVKWYRKAAEQRYAPAQCILGICYYNGQGVAQDDQTAMGWFLKAAKQGDEDARKMYLHVQLNGYANDGRYIPETIFNQFHSFGHGESVDVCAVNKAADGGLVVRGRLKWVGGMLNPSGWTDFDLLVGKDGKFQSFSLIQTTGLTKGQTEVVGGVCLAAGVIAALCSEPPPTQNPIIIQQNNIQQNTILQQQNNTLRVNVY